LSDHFSSGNTSKKSTISKGFIQLYSINGHKVEQIGSANAFAAPVIAIEAFGDD